MRIIGTGSVLPEREISNDELTRFLETSDEWIRTRTGIETRHVMTDETLDQLAQGAAQAALQNAGVDANELDMIICSTVQGEWSTPALACAIQRDIGAHCPAFDINSACAGFIYALDTADAYIKSGKAKRILIVCAEGMSRMVDWTDRSACVLFGDGTAAVVVDAGTGLISTKLTTTGNTEVLHARAGRGNCPFTAEPLSAKPITMHGQDVYKFAVSSSADDLRSIIADAGLTPADVDFYLLHQANKRIIDAVRTRLKQPPERFPMNIQHTGNTSSASVPILLDELNRNGRLHDGAVLALSAFGAGLVTGACLLKWSAPQGNK